MTNSSTEPSRPADIDPISTLAEAHAGAPQDPAARDRLWRGVFDLEEWHLLEHTNDQHPPKLLTGREDGRSCVLAYTSRPRAEVARAHFASVMPGQRVGVVSISRLGAAARSCSESGPEFLLFNQGTGGPGFGETLESIAAMQEYFADALPEGCLDRFARMALRINQPMMWGRLHRQMARRGELALVRAGADSGPVVITVNERRSILVFTHPSRCGPGLEAFRQAGGGRAAPVLQPLSGSQLVAMCAGAPKTNPAAPTHLTFNLGTTPFGATLIEFGGQSH
ncbi:MAG: hypothetical protein ACT4PL_09700 [Phycisphaerales bacterium]